jgi:Rrf2 family protein
MFRLSKKTDYSLMALKHILSKEDRPSSAREIAEAYGIPFEVLAKLLQTLARKGILVSQHGTKGGYSARPHSGSISVRDVMEAIDGPVALIDCESPRRGPCGHENKCQVKRPLSKVHEMVMEVLARTTLREI